MAETGGRNVLGKLRQLFLDLLIEPALSLSHDRASCDRQQSEPFWLSVAEQQSRTCHRMMMAVRHRIRYARSPT